MHESGMTSHMHNVAATPGGPPSARRGESTEDLDNAAETQPGLLEYDWDAALPPEPIGVATGPELADAGALFAALGDDTRPILAGPIDAMIGEVVRRIVAAWRPRRVLLFGSRARDEAGPQSDIDLLVELEDYTTAQRAVLGLYATVGRTDPQVDILVARPPVLELHRGQEASIYGQALRDGVPLYERPVIAAQRS